MVFSNLTILIVSILLILSIMGFFSNRTYNTITDYSGMGLQNLYFYTSRNLVFIMFVFVVAYIVLF